MREDEGKSDQLCMSASKYVNGSINNWSTTIMLVSVLFSVVCVCGGGGGWRL